MTALTDFLLARIAEAEAGSARLHALDCSLVEAPGEVENWCTCDARPRVLADCEAKRRIVERYVETQDDDDYRPLDEILVLLVQLFADHPDFDPAWRL